MHYKEHRYIEVLLVEGNGAQDTRATNTEDRSLPPDAFTPGL